MAFVGGRYAKARHHAEEAKALAPRLPAIREVLGLAAYRMGRWDQALTELRTYRRLSGDTTHLPVEMDVLRALERPEEVEATHALLRRLGGSPATLDEGKVVYASFLLDRDRAREAWELTRPSSLKASPTDGDLRVWYVAARAAARLGDRVREPPPLPGHSGCRSRASPASTSSRRRCRQVSRRRSAVQPAANPAGCIAQKV